MLASHTVLSDEFVRICVIPLSFVEFQFEETVIYIIYDRSVTLIPLCIVVFHYEETLFYYKFCHFKKCA